MKNAFVLVLLLLGNTTWAQFTPSCNSAFYNQNFYFSTVHAVSSSSPATSFTVPVIQPGNGYGLALGPTFSFATTYPALWTVVGNFSLGATYHYHNGTQWVNSNHFCPINTVDIGGSRNFLYVLHSALGLVYKYNGTGNTILVATVTPNVYKDIVGDDQDNFYLLKHTLPQGLLVYNAQGQHVCTYSVNGLPNYTMSVNALAIVGNTVHAYNGANYYIGTFSGAAVNFTVVNSPPFTDATDFASCPLTASFSSTINANPGPQINCLQTTTLTALSTLSPLNYTWSGPGIVSSTTSQSVVVNYPGVYTCTLANSDCPPKISVSSYTIINAGGFYSPVIFTTGSISCTNASVQLSVLPVLPSVNYTWTGPGIAGAANTTSINATSLGTYSVLMTNTTTGCFGTQTVALTGSITPLNVGVSSSTNQLCIPSSGATLTASGASSYSWFPSGSISGASNNTAIATPSANTRYTVVGSSGFCSGSAAISITAEATPVLNVSAPVTTVCMGTPVSLTVSGAPNYTWLPGNFTTAVRTYTPSSSQVFTITGKNGICQSAITASVIAYNNPTVTIVANPYVVCTGASSTVTATGAQTYTWLPINAQGSVMIATPTAVTNYTVVGTNSVGCQGDLPFALLGGNPPLALNISMQTTACTDGTIQGIATASLPASIVWQIGASIVFTNYISVPNPTPGVYNFSVFAQTFLGCPTTSVVQVTVFPIPSLGVVYSPTAVCAGSQVTLSTTGANNYTIFYAAQSGTSIVFTPTPSASYWITGITVNGCINNVYAPLTILPKPSLNIVLNPPQLCNGSSVTLSTFGATGYTWSPGGINSSSIVVSPSVNTVYTVSGVNAFGCYNTNSVSVVSFPTPTITAASSVSAACIGKTTTLNASTSAPNVIWLPMSTFGNSVAVSPSATSQYTALAIAANNCTSAAFVQVVVHPNPTITLVANPSVVCTGSLLTVSAVGANSYTWTPSLLTGATFSTYPTTNSSYSLIGESVNGCTVTTSRSVAVLPSASLLAVSSPSGICEGNSLTLTAQGANTYSWNPGNLVGAQVTTMPTQGVTFTVTGYNGSCHGTQTVGIIVYPTPTLTATGSQSVICTGESATISASGANTYSWSTGATLPSVVVSPSSTTSYSLYGVSAEGCHGQVVVYNQLVDECTSLRDLSEEYNGLRIYPNPSHGSMHVKMDFLTPGTYLEIYDGLGQLLRREALTDKELLLELNNYRKGVYIIKVVNSKQSYLARIVVN